MVTHFFEGAAISIDWLAEFHELAGELSKSINENIRDLYREDFGSAIERKIELKTHGRLHVLAVDCEGSGIGAVIRETADDFSLERRRDRLH